MSASVPLTWVFGAAAALFAIGLFGLLIRRNALFMLMALEIALAGASLALVGAGAVTPGAHAQVLYLLVLTVAAAEAAVGLGLILQVVRRFGSVDVDLLSRLRG